ncbi:MAG: 16S rRNA (cytidine(1402)-2'-O)-methyltransferase [Desulfobacteraceae bacterium 4572_88]|nr:MAG: 16S rRNA (cytidine(1402)-2'-O)-methyltransferase [Desulfobacteraceae bacterium 4572_88]
MEKQGKLYVVATPIGNMDDITLRALNVLKTVDLVAAEDTRITGKLFSLHNIGTKLISFYEHNESERIPGLIRKLEQGLSLAVVSDAGTPSVSDPGYRLVAAAIAKNIDVVPVPGVSAAVSAVSVSGLPTDAFLFVGFPPKKKSRRLNRLKELAAESATLVFYESPKRVLSFMEEIIRIMGDRRSVLGREMTKRHEEFLRGPLSEILSALKERPSVKGECTLLIKGCEAHREFSLEMIRNEIEEALKRPEARLSEESKKISEKYDLPKKTVYEEALRIKKALDV